MLWKEDGMARLEAVDAQKMLVWIDFGPLPTLLDSFEVAKRLCISSYHGDLCIHVHDDAISYDSW